MRWMSRVKLLARQGVERGERLVHQQHARIGRQRAGERDALLHAAGQFMHIGVPELLQADQFEMLVGDPRAVIRRQAGHALEAEHHVAEHVEPGKQRRFLKHHQAVAAGTLHRLVVGEHACHCRAWSDRR